MLKVTSLPAVVAITIAGFLLNYELYAQPTGTVVTDTIYNFDRTLFTGNVTITSPSFEAPTHVPITGGSKVVHVAKGVFSQTFVPNDTGIPNGTYYTLSFANGLYKTCAVPTSNTPVNFHNANCIDGTPAPVLSMIMLQQLAQGGATTGSPLCWLGLTWGPGSCGGGGIQSLNGLVYSSYPTQTFATATTGTDFTITSATGTHTFNLPSASNANRGLLTSADWSTFNNKQSVITGAPGAWPSSFTPSAHAITHASAGSDPITIAESQVVSLIADLAAKQATLVNYASISSLSGYPSSFNPSTHAATHAAAGSDPVTLTEAQITGLLSDLSNKAAVNAATTVNGQTCALGSTCTISTTTIPTTSNVLAGDGAGNATATAFAPSVVVLTTNTYSNPGWISALANSKITGLTAFATLSLGANTTYVRGDATIQTHNCAALINAGFFCSGTDAANLTGIIDPLRFPSPFTVTGPLLINGSGTGFIDLAPGVSSNPSTGNISLFFNSANSNRLSSVTSTGVVTDLQNYLAPTLSSGNIFVGNSSNVATSVTPSGDCTITNTGVVTCGKINNTTIPVNSSPDQVLQTTAGAVAAWNTIPNCGDSSHALAYNTTTHSWSCQSVTGGATSPPAFPINPQTTTYTATTTDFSNCKVISIASGTFTITLVANTSQPSNGQCIWVTNYGSGTVTIARNGQNINGAAANLTLASGSASAPTGAFIVSDGTNYFCQSFGASTGGTTVTYSQPYIQFSGNAYNSAQEIIPAGTFSWVDQGTSTVTTTTGGALHILFQANAASNTGRGYVQSSPGSTWTLKIHCKNGITPGCGFLLTSGSVCRSYFYGFSDLKFHVFSYTNATCTSGASSVSSVSTAYVIPNDIWMQLKEDGSHRTWSMSLYDGDYQQISQETTNQGLTPTNMGIGVDSNNTSAFMQEAFILSFSLTTP
jgi:hypothetical protein